MPPLREALPALSARPVAFPSGPARFEAVVALAVSGSLSPGRGERLAAALDEAGLLDPEALATSPLEEVVDALRDARIDADARTVRLLQRLADWYRSHRDDLECEPGPGEDPPPFPGDELVAINGVGRATADAVALHVFASSTYPVDRATYRIMVRHGWIDPTADYDEAAQAVVAASEGDPSALVRFSLGFADVGRRYCKASAPRCGPCPLKSTLPDGGPIATDG